MAKKNVRSIYAVCGPDGYVYYSCCAASKESALKLFLNDSGRDQLDYATIQGMRDSGWTVAECIATVKKFHEI